MKPHALCRTNCVLSLSWEVLRALLRAPKPTLRRLATFSLYGRTGFSSIKCGGNSPSSSKGGAGISSSSSEGGAATVVAGLGFSASSGIASGSHRATDRGVAWGWVGTARVWHVSIINLAVTDLGAQVGLDHSIPATRFPSEVKTIFPLISA